MKNKSEVFMRSMVSGFLALVFVTALVQSAVAADTAATRWSGFYGGVSIGYGWGDVDAKATPQTGEIIEAGLQPSVMTSSQSSWTLHPDSKGIIGGPQIGYNFQKDSFVFGIETDFLFSDMDKSAKASSSYTYPNGNNGYSASDNGGPYGWSESVKVRQSIDWIGTLRLRAGVAATPSLLLYATGGLAYARVKFSGDFQQSFGHMPGGLTSASDPYYDSIEYSKSVTRTETGWAVGGGAEYAINGKWSIKAEYLYIDLGDRSVTAHPSSGFAITSSQNGPTNHVKYKWDTQISAVRIGVNYRF